MSISDLMDYCTLPGSLVGGMVLCKATRTLNQFAATRLGIPIHLFGGKSDELFAQSNIDVAKVMASMQSVSLERYMGATIYQSIVSAVREEIAYRFLFERVLLPSLFPQLESLSLTRTCISTLLFSTAHLLNPMSRQAAAGQSLNTAFLGIITSLAQEHLGLASAISLHIGFNINGLQHAFNQGSYDILDKLRTIELTDALKSTLAIFLNGFTGDVTRPFQLAYRAYQICRENLPNLAQPPQKPITIAEVTFD